MRKIRAAAVLILGILFTASPSAADQKTTSGIYLTADDYSNGNITSAGDRNSVFSHNINLHDSWFGKSYIDVTHDGETRRYEKNEIWGFRDFDGKTYRFVGVDEYRILEAGKLFIYHIKPLVAPRQKGHIEPQYYFSVGPASAVVQLTLTNLKMAFPDNHRFHDYLDMAFHKDSELNQFDKFHNTYKVNRLLIASEDSDC